MGVTESCREQRESQREPEKVRKGLREPVRDSGSQREPGRDRERSSKNQREPLRAEESLREPVRARVGVTESQRETGREPVRGGGNHSELEITRKKNIKS